MEPKAKSQNLVFVLEEHMALNLNPASNYVIWVNLIINCLTL